MDESDTSSGVPESRPTTTKLASRVDVEHAIDQVLSLARHRIVVFARQLGSEWNREARVDVVRRFCLGSRRNQMRIVLHDAQTAYRFCPRLLALLRQFSHVISVQETLDNVKGISDPFVMADDLHYVHRFHHDGPDGLLATDHPLGTTVFRDRIEELWQASEPALPPTTLGL